MASESKETHRAVNIFMVLEVGVRGAAGLRIIRNAWDRSDFRGFESAWEGSGWLHHHKKCMGQSSFSWFWEWAGGGRLGSES